MYRLNLSVKKDYLFISSYRKIQLFEFLSLILTVHIINCKLLFQYALSSNIFKELEEENRKARTNS